MRILNDVNTYLTIKDEHRQVVNEFIFMYAKARRGKTLNMEAIIEEYHRAGYTILCLSDVKDGWELGYSMFPPEKPYHLMRLKKDGKPIQPKKVKLYHPISFNVPTNIKLPDINFYGFSLKEFGRPEWSMIAEAEAESDAIRLLNNASVHISNTDGIYNFLHSIQGLIIGKKKGRNLRPDSKLFHLKITGGTAKSLQDIASYFLPFQKHPFLLPNNSEYKLDWKQILNDNEHYHVFSTCWIGDEKIKELCILSLFKAILRNQQHMKRPILIVIPEIRFTVPDRPMEKYKFFLAYHMKSDISTMRNKGKGISFLADSQVWSDVDFGVRDSGTTSMFGQLGGIKDIENITKGITSTSKQQFREHLLNPDYPYSFMIQEMIREGSWMLWFPGHMHSEEEYSFNEMYKKYYSNKMKNYSSLFSNVRNNLKIEENKIKEKIKAQDKKDREEQEQKKAEKDKSESKNQDVEEKLEKAKAIKEQTRKQSAKLCYESYYNDSDEKVRGSYRAVGRKFGIHENTAKKRIEEHQKFLNEQRKTQE